MKRTEKTLASIVFHGPNGDKVCRREVEKLARRHGGKLRYTSFWVGRHGRWHSPDTEGKAAFTAVVPISQYLAAVRAARKLSTPGLKFSHRWAHLGTI